MTEASNKRHCRLHLASTDSANHCRTNKIPHKSIFVAPQKKDIQNKPDFPSVMNRGGYKASAHYSAPHHPQVPHSDRYYHPRPVSSDWDLQNHLHEPQGAPILQQHVRSPGALPVDTAHGMHTHHARTVGHQGHNFARDEANHSLPGHDNGAHFHPARLQMYQDNTAHYGEAVHERSVPPFVSIPPRPPTLHSDITGQHPEDRFTPGQGYDPRLFAAAQQETIQPSHIHSHHFEYGRPQSFHAPAPPHPYQQHQFQNGTDDVVDVEGSQRFRQFHNPFNDHPRPSTLPSHAMRPGQEFPLRDAAEVPVTCGVGIVFHSSGHGSLAVKRLVPGGPAAHCGLIKQGDILTHIDDTNVYQQSASDINHLISGPQGSFVRLRFKRSGSSPVVAVVERVWAPSTAERSKALSNGGGPPSKVRSFAPSFMTLPRLHVFTKHDCCHNIHLIFVSDFAFDVARGQQQF